MASVGRSHLQPIPQCSLPSHSDPSDGPPLPLPLPFARPGYAARIHDTKGMHAGMRMSCTHLVAFTELQSTTSQGLQSVSMSLSEQFICSCIWRTACGGIGIPLLFMAQEFEHTMSWKFGVTSETL